VPSFLTPSPFGGSAEILRHINVLSTFVYNVSPQCLFHKISETLKFTNLPIPEIFEYNREYSSYIYGFIFIDGYKVHLPLTPCRTNGSRNHCCTLQKPSFQKIFPSSQIHFQRFIPFPQFLLPRLRPTLFSSYP